RISNALITCSLRTKMKRNLPRLCIRLSFSLIIAAILYGSLAAQQSGEGAAHDTSKLPYMDPSLSVDERVSDLLKRMTTEEKITQLVNQLRPVPRLRIPEYDWWSESLHGVANNGTTELYEVVGCGAKFERKVVDE